MFTDTLSPKQARAKFGALKHQSMHTYMQFDDMNTGGVWRPETVDGDLVRYPSSFLVSNPRLTATIISWRFLSIPSRGYGRRLAVMVAAIWEDLTRCFMRLAISLVSFLLMSAAAFGSPGDFEVTPGLVKAGSPYTSATFALHSHAAVSASRVEVSCTLFAQDGTSLDSFSGFVDNVDPGATLQSEAKFLRSTAAGTVNCRVLSAQ